MTQLPDSYLTDMIRSWPQALRVLLGSVVFAARGELPKEDIYLLEEVLDDLVEVEEWRRLARALKRLLRGERDLEALVEGLPLEKHERQALAFTLLALEDDLALALLVYIIREARAKAAEAPKPKYKDLWGRVFLKMGVRANGRTKG